MPARAISAELAARVPVPVSAVWIAVLAHCAGSSDAVLFQVTDREILRRLELLREG